MSDTIIIVLLLILIVENSRFGVALMDRLVLMCKHFRHALRTNK